MDNYKARLLEAKTRYELEMIINELCNELCIIIELLDIRYYQKLLNGIEMARNKELKIDRIDTLVGSLEIISGLNIKESDL